MHRDVGAPLFQRHLQLFDEQALAAHLGQASVQDLITFGGHAQQVHAVPQAFEQGFHVLGLPQGKAAFAGGDGDGQGGRRVERWA